MNSNFMPKGSEKTSMKKKNGFFFGKETPPKNSLREREKKEREHNM